MPDTLHSPAWPGLQPGVADWQPQGGTFARTLQALIGRPGQILADREQAPGAAGFYRFIPVSGQPALFLKVVPEQRSADLLAAERIAAWLAGRGQPVSAMLATYPRRIDAQLTLFAYPFHPLRPAGLAPGRLHAVGCALGELHNALADLPDRRQIEDSTAGRNAYFAELERVSACTDADTRLPDAGRQVLHGDLNNGNLLIDMHSERPLFLDFEDSLHNAHAPCVDLAMLLERLVLTRLRGDAAALHTARAVIAGYNSKARTRLTWPTDLASVLRALSWRALLLLEHADPSRLDARCIASERRKFTRLLSMTRHRAGLLVAIQQT